MKQALHMVKETISARYTYEYLSAGQQLDVLPYMVRLPHKVPENMWLGVFRPPAIPPDPESTSSAGPEQFRTQIVSDK
jgi:hypothetical protein